MKITTSLNNKKYICCTLKSTTMDMLDKPTLISLSHVGISASVSYENSEVELSEIIDAIFSTE